MANQDVILATIHVWLKKYVPKTTNEKGTQYYSVPRPDRYTLFPILMDELEKAGLTKEDIDTLTVLNILTNNIIAPSGVISQKTRDGLRKAIAQAWKMSWIEKYANGPTEKFNPEENKEPRTSVFQTKEEPEERELNLPNNGDFEVAEEEYVPFKERVKEQNLTDDEPLEPEIRIRSIEEMLAEPLPDVEEEDWI